MDNNTTIEGLTFEQLPEAVATLLSEVRMIKAMLQDNTSGFASSVKWMNLQELCDYLPDHPAKQTVYSWIGQKLIPHHKKGKRLQFLKSEIDNWLMGDRRKTVAELQAEAEQFVNAKRKGGVL